MLIEMLQSPDLLPRYTDGGIQEDQSRDIPGDGSCDTGGRGNFGVMRVTRLSGSSGHCAFVIKNVFDNLDASPGTPFVSFNCLRCLLANLMSAGFVFQ